LVACRARGVDEHSPHHLGHGGEEVCAVLPFDVVPAPPPEDRPATLTLLVFEDGVFGGTNLLIRSDLYQGQECRSTGAPYRYIARIGYYECRHQSQAD
jgi:hypothetical protein